MIRCRWVPVLALGILAPCLAQGQAPDEKVQKPASAPLQQIQLQKAQEVLYQDALKAAQALAQQAKPAERQQMYEDIEIMRRLLNQGLRKTQGHATGSPFLSSGTLPAPNGIGASGFGGVGGSTYQPNWSAPSNQSLWSMQFNPMTVTQAQTSVPAAEGVYLKGQGVVFTITLPPQRRDPRPEAAKPSPKPMSDWDRTRNQVRGEKTAPEAKAAEAKEPPVADVVLKLLAENGHRFGQLGENETITVAVTFRAAHASTDSGRTLLQLSSESFERGNLDDTPAGSAAKVSEDHELLGDLHMKQGKHAEAVNAYQKAVAQNPRQEAVLQKLIQAQIATKNYDEAVKLLQKAREASTAASAAAETKTAPAPVAAALPAKLVISAPKRLLDQVATGKISFEDFKKAATVEYVGFPAAGGEKKQ